MAFCLHTNNVSMSNNGRFERNTIEFHFVGYLRSCHYAKDTHIVSDYLLLLLSSHNFVVSVGHKSCAEICMKTVAVQPAPRTSICNVNWSRYSCDKTRD